MSFRVGFTAFAVLAASLASAPTIAAQEPDLPHDDAAEHRVIVELVPGATVDELGVEPVATGDDAADLELFDDAPTGSEPIEAVVDRVGADGTWVALDVDDTGLAALEASDQVADIHPNLEISLSLDQSVPAIGAGPLPALGFDGTGTTVVVVDTGVDGTHPALSGAIVAEACFADVDCLTGTDIDLDTVPGDVDTSPGAGAPCNASAQDCRHGTHVAGIVAGRGAPRGVAPGAGIVSVRIFDAHETEDRVVSDAADLVAAMEWVLASHESWPGETVAVNLSLGYVGFQISGFCDFIGSPLPEVVADLRAAGIATVVATGNADGGPTYLNAVNPPACYSASTPVSATYTTGGLAGFAHRSGVVDLVAPGATSPSGGIVSARAGGGTMPLNGTSMAAPHVAGTVAVLREAEPDLDVDALEARMRDSGLPVAETLIERSYALVQVDRALCNQPRRVGCVQAAAGDGSATVEWGNLASPDRGVVEYRVTLDDGSPPVLVPVGSATSHTATGLVNEQRYTFLVEALGAGQVVIAADTSNPVVPKPTPGPHGFTDVPAGAYFESAVAWARAESVTTGLGNPTTFAPNQAVTRGEVVTFLWRMADQPTGSPPHGFPDVAPGVFYDQAVAWAKATGVTTGVGSTGRFRPDLPVTRAELVTFLRRAVGSPSGYLPDSFVDTPSGAFYDPAVRWAAFHGVTTGVGGTNRFEPNTPVTRADAVTFLRRAAADPAAWADGSVVPSTVVF